MSPGDAAAWTDWALLVEYDGAGFVGWQRQDRAAAATPSVQAVLEAGAAVLARAPVSCAVAGRTDAGVHAEGQVAMLGLPPRYTACQVRDALNFHMRPHAVAVRQALPAPPGWHPRFSAIRRSYRYRIGNRAAPPVLRAGQVWHVKPRLDVARMQAAADRLLGRHDFTSFRAGACQAASPLRTLDRLDVTRDGDLVTIVAEARSFLHHQVRNLVGTLKLVGEGRWTPDDVAAALAAADRSRAGPTAPSDGLALTAVTYPGFAFDAAVG